MFIGGLVLEEAPSRARAEPGPDPVQGLGTRLHDKYVIPDGDHDDGGGAGPTARDYESDRCRR